MAATPRRIVTWPSSSLDARSDPVTAFGADIAYVADTLLREMWATGGIGLAAIQVGIPLRACVVDLDPRGRGRVAFITNPVLVSTSDEIQENEEGCLSLPGVREPVVRAAEVVVDYLDVDGNPARLEADGLLAACVQHEIDHMDGITILRRISRLRRDKVLRQLRKATRRLP